MCELLGMSFNLPVKPSISFKGFRRRGEDNPHGWGLAFYPDESAQIIKEPIKAGQSRLSRFLGNYNELRSTTFIAHVRYTSVGSKSFKNTHPFRREVKGREYVFAHNGTLRGHEDLELGRFKPVGETDSEYAFCYLLRCIDEENITRWTTASCDWLSGKLKEINEYGGFNCVFSDGEHLFCYRDANGHNSLCLVHRKAPYERIRLLDEDWEINLGEKKNPEQQGFIIATRRLTNEQWQDFQFGELLVFKKGKVIYSNSRDHSDALERSLSCREVEILKVLRESPHRLSRREISEKSKHSPKDVESALQSLIRKGYVVQDGRDTVESSHIDATLYTEPARRPEIDALLADDGMRSARIGFDPGTD